VDGKPKVGSTQYFTAYGAVLRSYPLLRVWPLSGDERDPAEVLDLMQRVTLIPMAGRTLFGPRITIFTKDGKSYTREGTGREFVFDFETLVQRLSPVASGLPIGENQYTELIDACRHLDELESIGEDLIGLAVSRR
jgi:hypothetical protein